MVPIDEEEGWAVPVRTLRRWCAVAVLFSMMMAARFGQAYTLWVEDAESGTANIQYLTTGYSPIQSQIVAQGSNAFHLATPPSFQDNWFVVDHAVTAQADTKLFFQSRLQWATTTQVARVQVSTNGG